MFDQAVLGLTPDEMARFWVDQHIRGATQQPRTIASPELAVRVVASLPGAVTYVRQSKVGAAVRILTVDGRGPETARYLLAE